MPLHPPGPLPPAFLKASICSLSSAGIMPCFSANEMHSSKCSSDSQYASHSSLDLHAPGVSPFFMRGMNIFACSNSSEDKNPEDSAKARHSSMCSEFLQ